MGSCSSFQKLGARVSIVTLFVAQLAVGSLSFGFSPATAVAADTLLSDSFGTGSSDNDIPNWEEEGTDSDSHSLAQQPSGSGEDSASVDGGRFAKMRGGEWICRQVSAVGYNTLNLSYYWKEDTSAEDGESAIVEYFTGGTCDAPTGLTTLTSHELDDGNAGGTPLWSLDSLGLPGALSNSSFFIRFRNTADGSNDHLRIDGVVVTGEVIVASSSSISSSVASSSSSSIISSSSSSASSISSSSSSSSSVTIAYVCHDGNTTLSFELPTQQSAYDAHIAHEDAVGECESSSSSSESSSSSSIAPACLPTDETLVAYWKFDEGGESLFAVDSTAYANNGNVSGAVWNVSAPSVAFDDPYSMYFDGSNDVVTVTDTTGLSFSTNTSFSVTAWAKPTSFGGYQTIAHKIDDTGAARAGYLFTLNNGFPEVWLISDYANDAYTVVPSVVSLTLDQWSHVAFTYDGSGNAGGVRIYVDGSDVTGTSSQDTLAAASMSNTQPFEIGFRSVAGAQAFAGYLDDVRVYSAVLSIGTIDGLHDGQCGDTPVSSSSSSVSSSSSSASSVEDIDADEDRIPDSLSCSTYMESVCTPQPPLCTPSPDVCTPGPDVCIEEVCSPGPSVCVPGAPMCIPQPDSCIMVPVTTCVGPDNCPSTFNPDQADANENGTGDACEEAPQPENNDEDTDGNQSNGSYRGSRTNVLRSLIALFGGDGEAGDVPPGGFGGPGEEEFTEQETDVICRIRKALEEDASSTVRTWVAEQLAMKMPHSVEAIAEELKTGSICPLDIVRMKPLPKPIAFRIDALGFPVSSNDTWNKCIRGTATLQDIRNNPDRDDDGYGVSCSRYHTQDVWRHPDLSTYFTWKAGTRSLLLPAGYALRQDVAVTQK
jgi:hypothetical protein